jgi:2-methylcitrate dehydratase PrpD
MPTHTHTPPVAKQLAAAISTVTAARLPPALVATLENAVVDIVGLCVAARHQDYITSACAGFNDAGSITVIGHVSPVIAAAAAFVNGTAAHGEDFDDTFEGGPVHAGAVIVPAILAIAEQERLEGAAALRGIAVGVEVMCRLSLVKPKAIHSAGFHPTAVLGALGAAAGVSTTLGLPPTQLVNSLGIAGSMAGGIIEYLADGAWTKRMHPGWAAQSGLRAALLARAGFNGPTTVFEGTHGVFNGFARTHDGDWGQLLDGFGERWLGETLAFKPYPCGTMAHPYIDCARQFATRGIPISDIASITCETAEGFVHRLWEPLAAKQAPPNGYAGKFSIPFCVASAMLSGDVGLGTFTDQAATDPKIRALAAKIFYAVDPDSPYPHNYSGHMRVTLANGQIIEERQPHLRGGAHEPLTSSDIEAKFMLNTRHGGWRDDTARTALAHVRGLFSQRIDLTLLRQ